MKRSIAVCGALMMAFVFGCSTVESTQKFNALGLGSTNEKTVCHTYVEIPGVFFFGLPIVVGSPKGDGEWTMFQWTLNDTNVVYMLTKEAKIRGAARVVDVTVSRTHDSLFLPFLTYQTIQASGVGVRLKGSGADPAARQFEPAP